MHLRELRREDIAHITTIACDSFKNDEYMAFIAPYKDRYPLAWRSLTLVKQQNAIVTPGYYGFVCVSDGQDGKGEKGEILGYTWWSRKVAAKEETTDKYMQNNNSIAARIERQLRRLEAKYKTLFTPNQAESRASNAIIQRSMAEGNVLDPIKDVAHWHLSILAVAPKHQRKGVGKFLLRWGIDEATKESLAAPERPPVPITLTSSANGRYLYSQLGFRVIGWKSDILEEWGRAMLYDPGHHSKELQEIYNKAMEGKDKGDGGGSCMLFDPRSYWIEEVPEGTQADGKEVDAVWTAAALKNLKKEHLET